jgi:hypothetical protein
LLNYCCETRQDDEDHFDPRTIANPIAHVEDNGSVIPAMTRKQSH